MQCLFAKSFCVGRRLHVRDRHILAEVKTLYFLFRNYLRHGWGFNQFFGVELVLILVRTFPKVDCWDRREWCKLFDATCFCVLRDMRLTCNRRILRSLKFGVVCWNWTRHFELFFNDYRLENPFVEETRCLVSQTLTVKPVIGIRLTENS